MTTTCPSPNVFDARPVDRRGWFGRHRLTSPARRLAELWSERSRRRRTGAWTTTSPSQQVLDAADPGHSVHYLNR